MNFFLTIPALAAVVLIGCGGDKSGETANNHPGDTATAPAATQQQQSAPASSERKGCGWITEEEASTALGMAMKYRSNDSQSSNCILDEKAQPDGGLSVDFTVWDNTDGWDLAAKQKGAEPVSGLGERAVFVGGSMPQLTMVKNGKMLSAMFSSMTEKMDGMKPKVEAFGRVIADKM